MFCNFSFITPTAMSKIVAWLMVKVLTLPPPSSCGCPLYHPWKHENLSILAALGSASGASWVSWHVPFTLHIWSVPFLWVSGFWRNRQALNRQGWELQVTTAVWPLSFPVHHTPCVALALTSWQRSQYTMDHGCVPAEIKGGIEWVVMLNYFWTRNSPPTEA